MIEHPAQLLITNIDYDPYVGQIAIGRLSNGVIDMSKSYCLCGEQGITGGIKFSACYTFEGLDKKRVERLEFGDIDCRVRACLHHHR